MSPEDKRLLIGLGSGRCGTLSLAKLLNNQPETTVAHEGQRFGAEKRVGVMYWIADKKTVWLTVARILYYDAAVVGDVAFVYLPQVDRIIERHENVRFICLEREKKACVQSLLAKVTRMEINPYQSHNGTEWPHSDGRFALPKFDSVDTRPEAIGLYWDMYHRKAVRLASLWPDKFRIFPMEDLNTEDGVRGILDFCGFENPVIETGIRLNQGGA